MLNMEKIGKMIQFHRRTGKLSREKLAHLAGLGKTVIFDIEKGKSTVRLDTMLKILNVLNIKINFSSALMNLFERTIDEER